jgi:hypothetical protein
METFIVENGQNEGNRQRNQGEVSSSWNPTWLGSGVSAPSFGPDAPVPRSSVVGRGRAGLLRSLVEELPRSHAPHALRHQVAHSTAREGQPNANVYDQPNVNVYDQQESESSSDDEAVERLREHQEKWSEQMSFMAEQGKQLDMAMAQLMSRKEKKTKSKERVGPHVRHESVGDCDGRVRPILSSTHVVDSGDGSSLSSARGGRGGGGRGGGGKRRRRRWGRRS